MNEKDIFEDFLKKNQDLKEEEISKIAPIFESSLVMVLKLIGIWLLYIFIKLISPEGFNQDFLYALVFLPLIAVLKDIVQVFDSFFVRVAISKENIICKKGYFYKNFDKLYIKDIDNIELDTSLIGEWKKYGTIQLYSFGGYINLPYLKNYKKIYQKIEKTIEENKKEKK